MSTILGSVVEAQSQQPLAGLQIRAIYVLRSSGKQLLAQEVVTGDDGTFQLEYPANLFDHSGTGDAVDVHFAVSREDAVLSSTGSITGLGRQSGHVLISVTQQPLQTRPPGITYLVSGRVTSSTRAGVGKLRVLIVDKNVGGDTTVAETRTNTSGAYRVSIDAEKLHHTGKQRPDLQAQVYAANTLLGVSSIRYNAATRITLDVRLNKSAEKSLESEHETLTDAIASHYKGKLGDLREDASRQDITYLANKSGWDARAVAMAALAEQFATQSAADGGEAIAAEFFYALLRTGLPANANLYRLAPARVQTIWEQCIEQGVIPAKLQAAIPGALHRFTSLASARMLETELFGGLSPLQDLVGLTLKTRAQQTRFAELQLMHGKDRAAFWDKVHSAFGEKVAERLRVDSQLAFLTLGHAGLVTKLHRAAGTQGMQHPRELVMHGFHKAERWQTLLAGETAPSTVKGSNDEERLANYAEVQAARVRLSYPTATLARMVSDGDTPVTAGMADSVAAFLDEHQDRFEIGVQTLDRFLKEHDIDIDPPVRQAIQRIERIRQLTPGHRALNAVLATELDSAAAIARLPRAAFVERFAGAFGSAEDARLTHARAQQVHAAVLNVAMSALIARTAPEIGVHSPARYIRNYPTLENLFGSLDFCSCEHCRSLLSPAAYLVDLLHLLDPEVLPAGVDSRPIDALRKRRPDIEQLPLTCENTNTPLPYIDLVNEVLEYYVAHIGETAPLDDYAGHSTAVDADAAVLRATPATFDRASEAAYGELADAWFPTPLPFHRSLEAMRRYLQRFDVPLARLMEVMRVDDAFERPGTADDPRYGWRDILMEELGISRTGYDILTSSVTGTSEVMLWRLYGFAEPTTPADGITILRTLSNAGQFARRTGLTYEELASILRTRFINPDSELLPWLEPLRLSFAEIRDIIDGSRTWGDFAGRFPDGEAPDETLYGPGGVQAWLTDSDRALRIMRLVVLTIPAAPWVSGRRYVPGDVVRPTRPTSDSTLYYECLNPTRAVAEPAWPGEVGATLPRAGDESALLWICRDATNCRSFDNLALRYTDPHQLEVDPGEAAAYVDATVFLRLVRFIRLWQTLDWSIEQVDAAICTLYPVTAELGGTFQSAIATAERLDEGFTTLLPRLGIIVRLIERLQLNAQRDLLSLLACFAPIDTHGPHSLYQQMFLDPAAGPDDPNPFAITAVGAVLPEHVGTGSGPTVLAHKETLRAAFKLTGDEFDQIVAVLELDESEPLTLTLANISRIFRRAWLARRLKLSIRELSLLSIRSGIDPFAPLDPSVTLVPHQVPVLKLIDLVERLRAAGLRPDQALYLIWHEDTSGRAAPPQADMLSFAAALRASLAVVETEYTLPDDAPEEVIYTRMAQVYGAEATDFLFGYLGETASVDTAYPAPGDVPPLAAEFDAPAARTATDIDAASMGRIVYDGFRKRLSFSGRLTASTANILKTIPYVSVNFAPAIDRLRDASDHAIAPFFARYPELRPLFEAFVFFGELSTVVRYTHSSDTLDVTTLEATQGRLAYVHDRSELTFTGVMTAVMHAALSGRIPEAVADLLQAENRRAIEDFFSTLDEPAVTARRSQYVAANNDLLARQVLFLQGLLPQLKIRRKKQVALQAIGATAKIDPAGAQEILDKRSGGTGTGDEMYVLHAAAAVDAPALDDLTAIETAGLSAGFFEGPPYTTPIARDRVLEASLRYGSDVDNRLPISPSGGTISGVWEGFVQVPETGMYNFIVTADAGATVSVNVDAEDVLMAPAGDSWRNGLPIELATGVPVAIQIIVTGIQDHLDIGWQRQGQPRETIPATLLVPANTMRNLQACYLRFLATAGLAAALRLGLDEIAWTVVRIAGWLPDTGRVLFGGVSPLNRMPVIAVDSDYTDPVLLTTLDTLLTHSRLNATLSGDGGQLLRVLDNPAARTEIDDSAPFSLLLDLTRWNPVALDTLLVRFGRTDADGNADRMDLAKLYVFAQVHDAMTWLDRLQITAADLEVTNAPTPAMVRQLQTALRARYEREAWLKVLQPVSDELRALQRDALVAFILHRFRADPDLNHIDSPEKLFEFFLMDVQMDPCMQTSRIRHALSSVQLFIDRCLMNLEPDVSGPQVIDTERWAWMKRYRVWEANRKLYLWPENWLEPELRDDISPIFKETVSELLQGDITDERAAMAFNNYLLKLEEVAKLEPCGLFYQEPVAGNDDGVVHVVARTSGMARKYFYRRRSRSIWSPWEPIRLDIEDTPVQPVVWQGRLFLFWLRVLKEAAPAAETMGGDTDTAPQYDLEDVIEDMQVAAATLLRESATWLDPSRGRSQADALTNARARLSTDGEAPTPESLNNAIWTMRFAAALFEDLGFLALKEIMVADADKLENPPRIEKHLADSTISELHAAAAESGWAATRIEVKAALCWSEYSGGQWRPARVSGFDEGCSLGTFDSARRRPARASDVDEGGSLGTRGHVFNRNAVVLWTNETDSPANVIELFVLVEGRMQGQFKLGIPHGDPEIKESDLAIRRYDQVHYLEPERGVSTVGDTLSANYWIAYEHEPVRLADKTISLLESPERDAALGPGHRLSDPWTAPFFYSDARHAFFVTTDWHPLMIDAGDPGTDYLDDGPHVVVPAKLMPGIDPHDFFRRSDVSPGPAGLGISPGDRWLLTEELARVAHIRNVLMMPNIVTFQGRIMSVAGALDETDL